jgi:GAF domain-containing protein
MTPPEPSATHDAVPALTDVERELLESTSRTLLECEAGLDDDALFAFKVALRGVVPFDRISIHIEEADSKHFFVLWGDGAKTTRPSVFSAGRLLPKDTELGGRVTAPLPGGPASSSILESIAADGSPIERGLHAAGVRSLTTVPLRARGVAVGYLSLLHETPGAPSQRWLAVLLRLGEIVGPALVRARRLQSSRRWSKPPRTACWRWTRRSRSRRRTAAR